MTARRELRAAVLLCLLGAAGLLLALGRPWVELAGEQQLTIARATSEVTGRRLVPGAAALAYVGLAGVVAVAATRRVGRVVVGALLAVAGAGAAAAVLAVLHQGLAARAVELAGCCGRPAGTHPAWAWVAVVAALLLLAGGALVAARGRRWAALSAAYEAPVGRAEEPASAGGDVPAGSKDVWDALDRGDDPTA